MEFIRSEIYLLLYLKRKLNDANYKFQTVSSQENGKKFLNEKMINALKWFGLKKFINDTNSYQYSEKILQEIVELGPIVVKLLDEERKFVARKLKLIKYFMSRFIIQHIHQFPKKTLNPKFSKYLLVNQKCLNSLLIDCRKESEFNKHHIRDAINISDFDLIKKIFFDYEWKSSAELIRFFRDFENRSFSEKHVNLKLSQNHFSTESNLSESEKFVQKIPQKYDKLINMNNAEICEGIEGIKLNFDKKKTISSQSEKYEMMKSNISDLILVLYLDEDLMKSPKRCEEIMNLAKNKNSNKVNITVYVMNGQFDDFFKKFGGFSFNGSNEQKTEKKIQEMSLKDIKFDDTCNEKKQMETQNNLPFLEISKDHVKKKDPLKIKFDFTEFELVKTPPETPCFKNDFSSNFGKKSNVNKQTIDDEFELNLDFFEEKPINSKYIKIKTKSSEKIKKFKNLDLKINL
jgi:hypothetical protein